MKVLTGYPAPKSFMFCPGAELQGAVRLRGRVGGGAQLQVRRRDQAQEAAGRELVGGGAGRPGGDVPHQLCRGRRAPALKKSSI